MMVINHAMTRGQELRYFMYFSLQFAYGLVFPVGTFLDLNGWLTLVLAVVFGIVAITFADHHGFGKGIKHMGSVVWLFAVLLGFTIVYMIHPLR